jgi:hypothetical protein
MWHLVIWKLDTSDSEEDNASIFRVKQWHFPCFPSVSPNKCWINKCLKINVKFSPKFHPNRSSNRKTGHGARENEPSAIPEIRRSVAAEVPIHSHGTLSVICMDKTTVGLVVLRSVRFSPSTYVPGIDPYSSTIRDWYSRPIWGRSHGSHPVVTTYSHQCVLHWTNTVCDFEIHNINFNPGASGVSLTHYWLEEGIKFCTGVGWMTRVQFLGGCKVFLLSIASRPALRLTQPPIQWEPRELSPGVKRRMCEADHSPTIIAEVKNT